jgi:hypothetical protein
VAVKIHQVHQHGDFRVFYQHVNGEPAMVLASTCWGRRRAWVIGLSHAYKYADAHTGQPTAYLVEASTKIGEMLGLGTDRMTVFRIASAIVDDLPDLLRMPPEAGETANDIERRIERAGLVMEIDGNTLVDAR